MSETHVVSVLCAKRAELAGELIQIQKRLIQIRADLDSLDGAIRVFDPSLVPSAIRPRIKRKPHATFRHREFSRTVLAILRRAGSPMTVREIVTQLATDYRMDMASGKALGAMIAKVRNTLARQKDGTLASERRADGAILWRVA
jgi:hypothetical protein